MASCKYALKSNPSKTVDAKYIGYWSVRWSSDQASAALLAFQRPPLDEMPIMRAAVGQAFHTTLVLIAMHGAVYWALAAGVPALGQRIDQATYGETMNDLRQGRDDCLTELCLPSGDPLPKETRQQVVALFDRFYEDVLRDLSEPAPAAAIAAERISRVAASFITILQANFKVDFPHEQQVAFGRFVDQAVDRLAAHVQQELDVKVQAS